jgi:hypothetical protein
MKMIRALLLSLFALAAPALGADVADLVVGNGLEFNAAPGFRNFALDASTDTIEIVVQAPKADTITKVGVCYGALGLFYAPAAWARKAQPAIIAPQRRIRGEKNGPKTKENGPISWNAWNPWKAARDMTTRG